MGSGSGAGFPGPKELGATRRERGEGEEKEREHAARAGRERMQRGGERGEPEAKMSGLHRKELLGEGKPGLESSGWKEREGGHDLPLSESTF